MKMTSFPYSGSCLAPQTNKTLSQGQEVMFLFIVEATLTDISVQLNKGR